MISTRESANWAEEQLAVALVKYRPAFGSTPQKMLAVANIARIQA
jgi:hypothetical protein